jgi:hypothetical protein
VDPVSLIVAALVAGASDATKETASNAVKDAYAALKSLITRRLGREPDEDVARELHEAGADRDEDLVKAAQALLAQVDPDGARRGKYDVIISGGKGIIVGDSANVTMNFD